MAVKFGAYHRPESLSDALRLLAKEGAEMVPVAGGVTLALASSAKAVEGVDLGRAGLQQIKTGKGITLGAMATLGEVLRAPALHTAWQGLIVESCVQAATTPLRNLITVGGNISQVYFWSTLPMVLLALGATIQLADEKGRREVTADEFFAQPPRAFLRSGEIVTEVSLRPANSGEGAAYEKLSRTYNEYALVQAAALLHVKDGVCQAARLVVGAVTPLPVRCTVGERLLTGQTVTPELLAKAAQAGIAPLKLRPDMRAPAEYRAEMASVLLRRALDKAWQRAQG